MFDFYKSYVTNLNTATAEFAKNLLDANTQFAEAIKTQVSDAYKNLELFKFPGFNTASKTSKKSAE